jgi:hypothetical protein
MKKEILLAFLVFGFNTSRAEQVFFRGTVKDGDIDVPLIGAVVSLSAFYDKSFKTSTITDFNGAFSIALPTEGDYLLCVSFPGYISFDNRITRGDCGEMMNIELSEDLTLGGGKAKKVKTRKRRSIGEMQVAVVDASRAQFYRSKENDPMVLANSMTKKMRNRLQLTPTQEAVIGLTNQKYFSRVIELQSNPGDSTFSAKLYQIRKSRSQQLEEILTESQYEKWVRHWESQ